MDKKLTFALTSISILLLCAFTSDKSETPRVVIDHKLSYFKKEIVPILENRCSISCHGMPETKFKSLMEDSLTKHYFYFPLKSKSASIKDLDKNLEMVYRIAKGNLHDTDESSHSEHSRIDYSEEARFSSIIRKPLSEELGGSSHQGVNVFSVEDDEDLIKLKHWVNLEIGDHEGDHEGDQKALSISQQFFKTKVQGVFVRNGCFLSSCHNENVFNDLKLKAPLPIYKPHLGVEGGFSNKMTLHNHKKSLGDVSNLANLGGDVKLSRIIVKNLPLSEGGIIQRGGNDQFFESYNDEDVKTMIQWLELEKKQLAEKLSSYNKRIGVYELGEQKGLVFIRGLKNQKARFFDPDTFYPGSDIFLLKLKPGETLLDTDSKAINITKFFHQDSDVHIQAFDLRYDAKAIVFSMRKSIREGFRLYQFQLNDEFEVIENSLKQLSFSDDDQNLVIHHIDPNYMPDPENKASTKLDHVAIAFSSNENHEFTPSMPFGFIGELSSGSKRVLIDEQRTEKEGTFSSKRIHFLSGQNKDQWRIINDHQRNKKTIVGSILVLNEELPFQLKKGDRYMIENQQSEILPAYDIFQFTPDKKAHDKTSYQISKKQITFTSAQERRPTMRSTGEIMFTSLRNIGFQGDRPIYNGAIYRVQNGGFDYHIQGGNRSRYPIYLDSREMPQGLEVRLLMDPRNLWSGGQLVLVDHGFGVNREEHNPYDEVSDYLNDQSSSPPRFIKTQFNFRKETGIDAITHTGISPGGSFRDPYPLPNGDILVSYVEGEINHLGESENPDWNIYLIRFKKGLFSDDGESIGDFDLLKIPKVSNQNYAEYNARALLVRLKEKTQTHQKFTSSLKIKPKRVNGILKAEDHLDGEIECYDYPLLESFLTNFAPSGNKILKKNLKYVRILEHVPMNENNSLGKLKEKDPFATKISAGVHSQKRIIAEIPIASDGSFYAKVPSNVPLIIQGLNKEKMAIHSMNRYFYVQAGEKLTFAIPRSIFTLRCAGCHGSLTGKKVDGFGPPDLVTGASKVLATWDAKTEQRKKPGNHHINNKISIDFKRDLQPILDNKCVACHDGDNKETDLDLRGIKTKNFTKSYDSLLMLKDPNSLAFHLRKYVHLRK
ncbi:hypothetical protein MJH12_10220, partial [bacterium]|nr:hypothetical protein [bacterium]